MHKKCCQGSSFEKASTCTDFERLDEEEIGTRCETISVNGKRRHSLYHGKSATPETLLFAGPIVAVGGFLVSRLVPRHPTSTIFPREISRLIERRPRAESTSLFLFLPLLLHLFLLRTTNQIQMHIPNNRCAQRVVPLMKLWSTALCTPPSFTPRHRPIYRCSASRAQRVPTKKDPGASSSRRGGGGGGLVPAPEIKFEIDLSIAVKIGCEIRWPMVIERGGEVARERIRCETTLRYEAERERGGGGGLAEGQGTGGVVEEVHRRRYPTRLWSTACRCTVQ